MLRGGSWLNYSHNYFYTAHRIWDVPDYRDYLLGFRTVLHLQKDPDL